MRVHMFLPGIVLALSSTHSIAVPPEQAEIPFAKMGGIRDWQADGDRALYVQGRNQQWYRAELMGSCMDLPFVERIGFVIEPNGEFDRWSSIVVHGQECVLTSLTESGPPREKAGRLPQQKKP